MTYVPLRGRIIIRPTGDSGGYDDAFRRAGLVMPDTLAFDPRAERNQNSLGRGVIVAMGPPALDKWGVERAPDFAVGDEVLHIGQHKSRDVMWNGEPCRACAQEEVCAVVEAPPHHHRPDGGPYVCPGCYAVAPDHCLPGCIDAEIEAERRHLDSYGIVDDDTDPPPEFGSEGLSE